MPSKLKELVEAEAEAAEADDQPAAPEPDDDAEAEAEAEAEDEPEPAAGGIDEDALQAESKRHVAEMQHLLGDLFPEAAPCAYCDGSGVTPESLAQPPEMLYDEGTEACPKCNALGLVKTHGLREPNDTRSCMNCSGTGYITKPITMPGVAPAAPPPVDWTAGAQPIQPAPVPPETLAALRAAGYMVVEPPPGAPGI